MLQDYLLKTCVIWKSFICCIKINFKFSHNLWDNCFQFLRVDIFGDLGVNFNYGNEAVVSTREITIVNDLTFSYSGDCSVEKN